MGHLKGKRAFLTGASQGIGAAIAEGLIDAGADVCLHYFQSDGDAAQARRQGEGGRAAGAGREGRSARGGRGHGRRQGGDGVPRRARRLDQQRGLPGGAPQAGGGRRRLLGRGDSHQLHDDDVRHARGATRARAGRRLQHRQRGVAGRAQGRPRRLARLLQRQGRDHHLDARAGRGAGPQGCARELRWPPGLILGTRFHDTHTTKESADETVRGIPLGRGGTSEDVARAVVYLASEYDGFITGATLDINGGVYCA